MTLRDQGQKNILLRGLAYAPLFYAIVQAERALVGRPFAWWSETHFWIAVVVPVVFTTITSIQYTRANERPKR
jgi:hypothetical protein